MPKDVITWCNQQVDEGKELKFTWDGGNDSGYASLVLDDNEIEVAGYSDILLDGIYEELDYGSWAGEFYASGEAIYNKEEQAFIGIDDYTELLVHCRGADESTTFTDASGNERSVSAVATAQVDTAQTDPFGGNDGVLLCDGDSDYLTVSDFDELDLDSADFTFDFWHFSTGKSMEQ